LTPKNLQPPPPPKVANPAVVGLAGFAIATLLLQFYNLGLLENKSPFILVGLFVGGLAQVIAGERNYFFWILFKKFKNYFRK
jgi:succinate-acetate transporter protein